MAGKKGSNPDNPYQIDVREFAGMVAAPDEMKALLPIVKAHAEHLQALRALAVDKEIEPPLVFSHEEGGRS